MEFRTPDFGIPLRERAVIHGREAIMYTDTYTCETISRAERASEITSTVTCAGRLPAAQMMEGSIIFKPCSKESARSLPSIFSSTSMCSITLPPGPHIDCYVCVNVCECVCVCVCVLCSSTLPQGPHMECCVCECECV